MDKLTYTQYKELKDISFELINKYHLNDIDKGGNPYVNHLVNVSNECAYYESKIIALLHDILEDTDCTEDDLLEKGIPFFIIEGIKIVTRRDEETYNEFITRILESNNIYALDVKYNDIKDNSNIKRVENASEDLVKKVSNMIETRYTPALKRIELRLKDLSI